MVPAGVSDRLMSACRKLVLELTTPLRFHALVRYRVVQTIAGRLELQIVRKAFGFPDILPIGIACGIPGGKGTPANGSVCLVQFIEGDPGLPVVTAFARPDDRQPGVALVRIATGSENPPGDPTGRVLRYGDTISTPAGDLILVPGVIPQPFSKVKAS